MALVATNSGYARIVMVLAGVQTDTAVGLTPSVTIGPFTDLEPPFEPVATSAALVVRVPFSPVFTGEDQAEGAFPEQELTLLSAGAHCLALAAASSQTTSAFEAARMRSILRSIA